MSRLFLRTLRDDPADAEIDSHRLLLRAGCIRRLASGIYAWLPLGQRVLANVTRIVREEMDAAGAQEMTLPIAQPLELWKQSGRDEAYGPLMFRLTDRKDAEFCLSPTAEEAITSIVAGELSSYRDLPVNVYQINWKYRDELRPRFGLLRSREFLMKDAYSFHVDADDLRRTYHDMYDAYTKVFERCALDLPRRSRVRRARSVATSTTSSWRSRRSARTTSCGARAATTRRTSRSRAGDRERVESSVDAPARERVHTPDMPGITAVAEHLGVGPGELLKCIVFDLDGELGRRARTRRPRGEPGRAGPGRRTAVGEALRRRGLRRAPRARAWLHRPRLRRVSRSSSRIRSSREPRGWVTGANEVDHHVRDAVLGRDFEVHEWADLVTVVPGDPCPSCGSALSIDRGIEVGQVFELGTKYAEALDALYTDESGDQHPMVMGCYGIGISRIVTAVVEEHHDDDGIVWPAALAPYDVHLVALPGKGDAADDVRAAAEEIYAQLGDAGITVLYDDRDASPGVKFADADLLGMPIRLTVGAKGVARGIVERRVRATGEQDELPVDDVVGSWSGPAGR